MSTLGQSHGPFEVGDWVEQFPVEMHHNVGQCFVRTVAGDHRVHVLDVGWITVGGCGRSVTVSRIVGK